MLALAGIDCDCLGGCWARSVWALASMIGCKGEPNIFGANIHFRNIKANWLLSNQ